jgi:hypothetical protein
MFAPVPVPVSVSVSAFMMCSSLAIHNKLLTHTQQQGLTDDNVKGIVHIFEIAELNQCAGGFLSLSLSLSLSLAISLSLSLSHTHTHSLTL